MESTSREGGRGSWSHWINRYRREQTGPSSYIICSSCSSGTTRSTSYTSSAASLMSMDGHGDAFDWTPEEKSLYKGFNFLNHHPQNSQRMPKEVDMKQMVKEFFAGAPSAHCGGDMGVLERWFTDLGVAWVLHLPGSADDAGRMLKRTFDSQIWLRALTEIKESVRLTTCLSPVWEEEEEEEDPEAENATKQRGRPDQFQIAQFFQQAMLKMLAFVDVAVNEVLGTNVVPQLYEKLNTLLYVHTALSNALLEFQVRLHSSPSVEAESIESEMVSLLSANEDKARETICDTLVGIWGCLLESMEGSSATQTPQAPPDIHILTDSVMGHITFLLNNFPTVASIVAETASRGKYYMPHTVGELPLDSVIMEMMDCLEEKLVSMSNSFPDQGLGFLFLLNNTWHIRESLRYKKQSNLATKVLYLTSKIEGYKERYLEVSWAPSVSCLFNPSHLSFWKRYSPLSRFEYEFQKTYTTQKLWKVPCTELRKCLRQAITQKIIPDYKNYLEDNKVTAPKFTPENLYLMLLELFEG